MPGFSFAPPTENMPFRFGAAGAPAPNPFVCQTPSANTLAPAPAAAPAGPSPAFGGTAAPAFGAPAAGSPSFASGAPGGGTGSKTSSAPPAAKPSASSTANLDLINAAEMGDLEALRQALAHGADVDFCDPKDPKQQTPLHWAAKCGRAEDIEALLEHGAKVDALTKAGVTPLIVAASEGWDDCVPLLLKGGASVTAKTLKGRTAVQAAREKLAKVSDAEEKARFEKVVRQLEAAEGGAGGPSAAPSAAPFGAAAPPALFGAAAPAAPPSAFAGGSPGAGGAAFAPRPKTGGFGGGFGGGAPSAPLAASSSPNASSSPFAAVPGGGAFVSTAKTVDFKTMGSDSAFGANPPFSFADVRGSEFVTVPPAKPSFAFAPSRGAPKHDSDESDDDDREAPGWREDTAEYQDPQHTLKAPGTYAASTAPSVTNLQGVGCLGQSRGLGQFVSGSGVPSFAPSAPAKTTAAPASGANNLLLKATESADLLAMRSALKAGASLVAVDARQNTALHIAARDGRFDSVKLLCENRAPVQARNAEGVTPLMLAAANGWDDCVTLLLTHGADPKASRAPDGATAISLARDRSARAKADERARYEKTIGLLVGSTPLPGAPSKSDQFTGDRGDRPLHVNAPAHAAPTRAAASSPPAACSAWGAPSSTGHSITPGAIMQAATPHPPVDTAELAASLSERMSSLLSDRLSAVPTSLETFLRNNLGGLLEEALNPVLRAQRDAYELTTMLKNQLTAVSLLTDAAERREAAAIKADAAIKEREAAMKQTEAALRERELRVAALEAAAVEKDRLEVEVAQLKARIEAQKTELDGAKSEVRKLDHDLKLQAHYDSKLTNSPAAVKTPTPADGPRSADSAASPNRSKSAATLGSGGVSFCGSVPAHSTVQQRSPAPPPSSTARLSSQRAAQSQLDMLDRFSTLEALSRPQAFRATPSRGTQQQAAAPTQRRPISFGGFS